MPWGSRDATTANCGCCLSIHEVVDGSRKGKPTRVLISCELLTPINTMRVTLRDISRTTAHVIGARTVPVDCDAILRRGPLFAAVRVSSVTGDEALLKFYRPMSADDIEAILPGAALPPR
jgi:hypothetical protein